MVTHSSILAWRIPWTEEPGGLYSPWGCKESDTTEHAHYYIIVQISFTALETCALLVHPFPHTSPGNHMFYFLHNLLFLECYIVGIIWLVDFPD